MGKTKVEKSMYSYKIAWLAGADLHDLKCKLQKEASFAAKPLNNEWYGNKGKVIRSLCNMRTLMLRKYKAFKKYNSFEKPLDEDLYEYEIKSRLDPVLEELPTELVTEMSKTYKMEYGCLRLINFISLWMYDNCSKVLEELDIPYPEEVSKRLFVYPGFNSEDQLMAFTELRLSTDYSSSLGVLIPIGVVDKQIKKTLFLGDRNFYSILLNIEPDKVELPEKVLVKWDSDERYFLQGEVIQEPIQATTATEDFNVHEDQSKTMPELKPETELNEPNEPNLFSFYQEEKEEPFTQEESTAVSSGQTSQVPNVIVPSESGITKTSLADVPYIDVGIELDQPKISTYSRALSKVFFNGPERLFPKDFIGKSDRAVLVIDCDNVNFFKTVLVVNDILRDYQVKQIQLHLDQHSLYIWNMFDNMVKTNVPIIKHTTCRIKDEKSSVDIAVTAGVCESIYRFGCNCVVLFSSDSDFLALIDSVNKIKSKEMETKWMICYESYATNRKYLDILADRNVRPMNIDVYLPDGKLPNNIISAVVNYTVGKVLLKKTVGEWLLTSTVQSLVTYVISTRNKCYISNMPDRLIYYLVEEAVEHLDLDFRTKIFRVNNMYFELQ